MADPKIKSISPTAIVAGAAIVLGGIGVIWFAFQLLQPESQPRPPVANATYNISITQTGFHAILPAAVEVGLWEQQTVALTEQGKAVPYLIQDDQLVFFGREQDSIYSRERVYQLHLGESASGKSQTFKRFMAEPNNTTPAQSTVNRLVRYEEDARYVSIARSEESVDTWYWEQIHVSDTFEFTADLPHAADGSATLTAHLFGLSHDSQIENDHDLDLVINGTTVNQIIWDGNKHAYPQITLPPGTINAGENIILLDNRPEGNAFIDISEIDWLTLSYPAHPVAVNDSIHFETEAATLELDRFSSKPLVLAYFEDGSVALAKGLSYKRGTASLSLPQSAEVFATGPEGFLTPEKITPIPVSGLMTASQQSDLIIISDRELAPALSPLVEAREAQGLSVTVATVEDIYNQFGFGQPSPQAIQAYLAEALTSWPAPAPRYLLLAGGTTYDYRNNLEGTRQNRVPSLLVGVSHSGETASDTQLADVDGDNRADFAVGRWPVDTPEEVTGLVERTLAYERTNASENLLFAADGTDSDFGYTADRLISSAELQSAEPVRAYGASWEAVTDHWNSGNWLITYVGHGSVDLWGSKEVLSSERVSGLKSPIDFAPPIVLQFTCLTGFFIHPEQPSISEEMLLSENGPVLIVSATSLTYSSSQEPFAAGILSRLTDPSVVRMGDVLAQSKAELDISNSSIKEVYDTFVLLGDPSAMIARPEALIAAIGSE
ncbi:MAG: C25 family cysteine peptidase [Anaerolineae bacterium]